MKTKVHSSYLHSIYHTYRFKRMIKRLVKNVRSFRKKHAFDAIAFTGTSGAAVAYPLSFLLDIPLICIRKDDNNHYGRGLEGYAEAMSYIIVDDFISSGDTIKRIVRTVRKESPDSNLIGILLYACGRMKSYRWDRISNCPTKYKGESFVPVIQV